MLTEGAIPRELLNHVQVQSFKLDRDKLCRNWRFLGEEPQVDRQE